MRRPSCTVPIFSKMPLTTHMIHSAMPLMRITRLVARAMAPTLIRPWLHSHRARPVVEVISTPFITVMVKSMLVTTRPMRWLLCVSSSSASRA
ncbi:hypothetical protein D9M70_547920 [compost metagenome]